MNIRCSFCQMPYAIGRNEMLGALQRMSAENLHHYDAHCPRCKRATPIPRPRMEMFFPNWRDALKDLEAEMDANPQHAAPPPAPKPAPVGGAESSPAPAARAESGVEGKPVPKEEAKPAASASRKRQPAAKAKTAPKKPAARKVPAASSPKEKKPAAKKSK